MDDNASALSVSTHRSVQSSSSGGGMSEEDQIDRRKQIKQIMADPSLDQKEKSLKIQSLMDGRRRSSCSHSVCSSEPGDENNNNNDYVSSMARAAALAAEYYSSDDDATMSDDGANNDFDEDYYTNQTCRTDDNVIASDNISYGYDWSDSHTAGSNNNNYNLDNQFPSSSSYDGGRISSSKHSVTGVANPSSIPYRQFHGRSMSLQDWKDTDRVAAAANTNDFIRNPKMVSRLMEQSRPPCPHYERNCTIISPCCGLAFGCRICHDDCPVLPQPLSFKREGTLPSTNGVLPNNGIERRRSMPLDFGEVEEETHHLINRFAIREVICRECYERQSSKTNLCIKCGVQFGEYHCNICNLWMSDQELPYHCEQCGFCRVGGRENFTHCNMCGMCIDAQLFDDHNCKSGKYMSNCPICQEDLFSSRFASHEMPCGHAIHWHCFKELTSYDTRCPVCKKTAESPEQMQSTWSAIAMGIALQPVPPEMARVVDIVCNDCETYGTNSRWHFLGVRCTNCLSFNTVVERIVLQGQDAADFLDDYDAQHGLRSENGIPLSITATVTQNGYVGDNNRPHNDNDTMDEEDF